MFKMLFSKVLIVVLTLCIIINHAQVLINIEPEELQRIGEIVVTHYFRESDIGQSKSMLKTILLNCKKISTSLIQLIGIMLSLVGANLLASMLETYSNSKLNISSTITTMKICNNDFGCNKNLCWRSCDNESDEKRKQGGTSLI